MFKTFAALLIVSSTTACVDQEDDVEIINEDRLIGNGLSPLQLWNASLQSALLDETSLHAMSTTADGRAALGYVVGCALATGHNVSTTYDPGDGSATPITYPGAVGLADGWTSAALTLTQQRWVSGCTLARVNKTGTNITISMRGTLSQFALAFNENVNYPVQEGAFFGNVFQGTDFQAVACKGSGTANATGRDCAEYDPLQPTQTQCQYNYAGTCSSICSVSGGVFTSCSYGGNSYLQPVMSYTQN